MNIAELFVRIRGDTTDLHRKLTDAERALLKLEKGAGNLDGKLKIAGLSTGRLGNQFANLAGRIAHTSPIVGNLASVLGDFAVGGVVTAGVLAGLAAIAVAYDRLTESARKTKEETEKALTAIDKAAHLKMLGPGGEMVDQTEIARREAARLKIEIAALEKEAAGPDAGFGRKAMLEEKINQLYIDRQNALNRLAEGESMVKERVNEAIDSNTKKVKEMTFGFNELRNAAEKVNAEILESNKDWWRSYIEKTGEAVTLTEQLNRAVLAARPSLLDVATGIGAPPGAVDISDSVRIAGDQAKKINDASEKHSELVRDAIWGSATMLANTVVSSMNFGGGGRGSNVGGSIGSLLGAGLTIGGGIITSGIWGIVGGIVGSMLGGLFDHKKSVDRNSDAINRMTSLFNQPTGYKVNLARFNASAGVHVYGNVTVQAASSSDLVRELRAIRSRGGPNNVATV